MMEVKLEEMDDPQSLMMARSQEDTPKGDRQNFKMDYKL